MGRRASGVLTIPGYLTSHLDDLDLSRKDLAELVGVTVRTIHNIEHGCKRVDRRVIRRLAAALNERSQLLYPEADSPALTADHFTDAPESVVTVLLQSIALNRADMLFTGDTPIASSELHWHSPGNSDRIAFAGRYSRLEVCEMYSRLHAASRHVAIDGVRILADRTNTQVTVRAMCRFAHPDSKELLTFPAYLEIELTQGRLGQITSTYDTELLSTFLDSGEDPRRPG